MVRASVRIVLAAMIALAVPSLLTAQFGISPSLEVGLGMGYAGHGVGTSGKLLARLTVSDWGVGARLMGMDGDRRQATSCFLFCRPIESFTERSALIYRVLAPNGYRIYVGAGIGRLSGRRFIGSSTDFDRDVSEWGFAFDVSAYMPPGYGLRFTPSVYGHIGPGGVAAGLAAGIGLTR